MGTPIIILAGQSNAAGMARSIRQELNEKYGVGGYRLVEVYAPGAPLTYSRSAEDWFVQSELPDELVDRTLAALSADPSAEVLGLIWLQGEADTYTVAPVQNYDQIFSTLIGNLRSEVTAAFGARDTGIETTSVVISTLSIHAPAAPDRSNWGNVRNEHLDLAASSRLIELIDPDQVAAEANVPSAEMFKDGLHYTDTFKVDLAKALVTAATDGTDPRQYGTSGDDVFAQRAGATQMIGGAGNDVYGLDHVGDSILEAQGEGTDTVVSSVSLVLSALSDNVENIRLTGTGNLSATGNSLGNDIQGNAGDNILNGGAGSDRLEGGRGNDGYIIDRVSDVVVEYLNEGYDWVSSNISYDLGDTGDVLDALILRGSANLSGTGNALANYIEGNGGNNLLDGGLGRDTLVGGDGNDTFNDEGGIDRMVGGAGNDVYYVDHIADTIVEKQNDGTDTIYISFSASIRDFGPHIERLVLTGDTNLNATGNGSSNVLTGNSGNNTLNGGWGNDVIFGKGGDDTIRDDRGSDTMSGGAGADRFVFRGDGDRDVVTDFELGVDRIEFTEAAGLSDLSITQSGQDTVIEYRDGSEVILEDIQASALSADHFDFT